MRTLAVTGGIGSGKSYVVRMFAALGVPVYDADARTKELYASDPGLLSELKTLIGDAVVRDGVLDRQYMASRIFADKELLSRVEAAVFPRVLHDYRRPGAHGHLPAGDEGAQGDAPLGHDAETGSGTHGQSV